VRYEQGCSIRRAVPPLDDAHLGPERITVEVFAGTEPSGSPVAVIEGQPSTILLGAGNWPEDVGPPLLIRARATFTPPSGGTWRLGGGGLHHARLLVDGEEVADNQSAGAISAGLGNHLGVAERVLEEGRPVELALEYELPASGMQLVLANLGAAYVGEDPEAEVEAGLAAAAEAAAGADVAVIVVGSNHEWESEGADRADLALPGAQDELVRRVVAANSRTVVVHNSGSPMAMPWVDDVAAIVQAWYPGQEAGRAVADVLVGDTDPGGRMPTTWPVRIEDTPADAWYPGEHGHVEYGEGLLVGHRWYETQGIEPLWAFGHGLSYTTFDWGEPMVKAGQVTVRVRNTGDRTGVEVVQAYVAGDDRPATLAGFARVELEPGDEAEVTVALSPATFRRWVPGEGWTTGGEYEVRVGRSSRDILFSSSSVGPGPDARW
jgi:beta-glucosidase